VEIIGSLKYFGLTFQLIMPLKGKLETSHRSPKRDIFVF